MMRLIVAYAAVWIGLAIGFGALIGSLNLPGLWAINASGIKAQAKVLALEPMNHQLVRYSYRVGGNLYTGAGTAGYGNPAFSHLTQGDTVLVYYLASEPERSVLGDARQRLREEIKSVVTVMLMFPTIIVAVLASRRRTVR